MIRQHRIRRRLDVEPHLTVEFDLRTRLFTVTLSAQSQPEATSGTLDMVLTGGKAAAFLKAALKFEEPPDAPAERCDQKHPAAA